MERIAPGELNYKNHNSSLCSGRRGVRSQIGIFDHLEVENQEIYANEVGID